MCMYKFELEEKGGTREKSRYQVAKEEKLMGHNSTTGEITCGVHSKPGILEGHPRRALGSVTSSKAS